MPIGNYYYKASKNRMSRIAYRLFGLLDLHTHIRLKPLVNFIKDYSSSFGNQLKVLELGCGCGINAFEIQRIIKNSNIKIDYIGVDLSAEAINLANKTLLQITPPIKGRFRFSQEDANNFLKEYSGSKVDIALLIDVIEHIVNPKKFIGLLNEVLATNGLFIISVPTPLYPRVFGRRSHVKVGHLIDGYTEDELDRLFEGINCQKIISKYNTGFLSNIACWLCYNKLNSNNKYFNFFKFLVLYPFKFLDFYNSPRVSCSLFSVYIKK